MDFQGQRKLKVLLVWYKGTGKLWKEHHFLITTLDITLWLTCLHVSQSNKDLIHYSYRMEMETSVKTRSLSETKKHSADPANPDLLGSIIGDEALPKWKVIPLFK